MEYGRLIRGLLMAFLAAALSCGLAAAMTMNLSRPYGTYMSFSPVELQPIIFSSPQSDSLIFDDEKEIVIRSSIGLRAVSLKWTLARNQFRKTFLEGTGEPLPDNSFLIRIDAAALKPGLYDLRVKVDTGDRKSIDGRSSFGYRVKNIQAPDYRPADFADFWRRGREEINAVPLQPEMGPVSIFKGRQIEDYNLDHAHLPASYDPEGIRTDTVEVRQVAFNGARGRRIYGWLAKPQGKGPFPAMLVMPGAGGWHDTRPMPLEHARHGFVALDLAVHGQPGGEPISQTLDTRERAEDHIMYLNALQAVNFMTSLPEVDKKKIVVAGMSQGGRLSLVTAALDDRIAAAVPAIAHFAWNGYSTWARGGKIDGMGTESVPPAPQTDADRSLAYYDVLNFAADVKCPVFMNVGLIDDVSPAESLYAVFNRLGSRDKTILPMAGISHFWTAEADRRAWRWLEKTINY